MSTVIEQIAWAKDIRINLTNVLTPEGSPGLTQAQIFGIALASAFASRNGEAVEAVRSAPEFSLTPEQEGAAKSAASIMAMNNVYYRFLHLVGDADYRNMPARLRMTVIANPGVDKTDFELYSLAVSAINGCGFCIEAHAKKLAATGISKEAVQSAARIAAVVQGAAQALAISQTDMNP